MAKIPKLKIEVERTKAFDELCENVADIAKIMELVPDQQRAEANRIAQRIFDRQKGWVSISS